MEDHLASYQKVDISIGPGHCHLLLQPLFGRKLHIDETIKAVLIFHD